MKDFNLLDILRMDQSVFSFKEIFLNSKNSDSSLLKRRINYYVKKGELYPLRRGIYAKNSNYDKFELAVKIYTPSYISFETVLARAGVIFQFYSQIFIASYLTREINIDNQIYSYKKIKDAVLTDSSGLEKSEIFSIASPERAFLDVLYLNKTYHFDNLSKLNWEKVFEILPIYRNKRLEKTVNNFYKNK